MKALEELGLTNYEAKTYHTLLSIGISDAKEIHVRSGVPWGRIYDVLNTLEGKGLVESQSSRPKQFLPVEPRLALETLLELKNREIEMLTEKAARIESELNEAYRKPQEESMFWNVTLGDEMGKKILEKMVEANAEVLVYAELPNASAALTENEQMQFIDILQDLVRDGVEIQILLATKEKNLSEELLAYLAPYMGLQGKVLVRVTSQITSCFDIIDGEKVFLKVPNPLNPSEYFAAIYVWQKRFAHELKAKFTEMWNNAKQLQIGIEE